MEKSFYGTCTKVRMLRKQPSLAMVFEVIKKTHCHAEPCGNEHSGFVLVFSLTTFIVMGTTSGPTV